MINSVGQSIGNANVNEWGGVTKNSYINKKINNHIKVNW